jgi:predicted small lipoprotein YifL
MKEDVRVLFAFSPVCRFGDVLALQSRDRMPMFKSVAVALLLFVAAACGSKSPATSSSPAATTTTTTTTTTAPAAIPMADLKFSGQTTWTYCSSYTADCYFSAAIQNVGAGCGSGKTVIARFYDGNGQQVGSDVEMSASGGLSTRILRPQEIVAIDSSGMVPASVISRARAYRLFPTWDNVKCS